jgi:DNA-binding MarR family transcriptional regulator
VPGSSTSSAEHIMTLLRRFTMETERYVTAAGAGNEMHRTDMNALAAIMDAGRTGQTMSPGRLSALLRLSAPATSALLDRLEEAGHVRRVRSSVDRRRVELVVTDRALAAGRSLFGPLAEHLRPVIERYTPAQQDLVAGFLADAASAVQSAARSHDTTGPGRTP